MVGLPAYLLGKQGIKDATFLPEVVILKIVVDIQAFKR